jgi:hypothetical protein
MNDSLLIRGAAAILTGLPGAAMRHDVIPMRCVAWCVRARSSRTT